MATSKAVWRIGHAAPSIEPHTHAKHRVIRSYIRRYLEIVTQNWRMEGLKITFVDGYSGGGRYSSGGENYPGSPLLFLSVVSEMEAELSAARGKEFRIDARYIFIDSEKRHTEFLRAELEDSNFVHLLDRDVNIWTGDFNTLVDDAIREVRRHSPKAGCSLFLLDQFGWSQVSLSSVRKILQSLPKTEVFLTFMVDALANYISEQNHSLEAFGRIDVSPEFVREMLRHKEEDNLGSRVLIQNLLYGHIRDRTGVAYYSPFMIKSPESNRSHWFLHLSKHHEARNEIGEIHWRESNTTTHHGRPGFYALGFTPTGDIGQFIMESLLDDHARERSRAALQEQMPQLIYDAVAAGNAPSLVDLFGSRSSDTPLVKSIIEPELIRLRDEGDIVIRQDTGAIRPRARTLDWTDRFELAPSPTLFGPFATLKKRH